MKNQIKEIVLEWAYEPKEFFETDLVVQYEDFELLINDGLVSAIIIPNYFEKIDSISSKLTQYIESKFMAVQVMTHEKYKLSKPSRYDLRIDGGRNIYCQFDSSVCVTSVGVFDTIQRDEHGNIVADSKQERIKKKKRIADLATRFRFFDATLDQMLRSYNASVSDPKNELIHLYEIRDAAVKKFCNSSNAKSKLNITNDQWNTLGRLANNEPLTQGRHRGANPGALRDAESSELNLARKIAAQIIENYLNYLENENR